MQPKLIIFDLDGTLIDSAYDLGVSINHTLLTMGFPKLEEGKFRFLVGNGLRMLIKRAFPEMLSDAKFIEKALEVFSVHYQNNLLNKTAYFDGAERFLETHPALKAVATNKSEKFMWPIIEGLSPGKKYYVDAVGGDRFEEKKPAPKALIHLMELTGAKPHETLMVGDSPADLGAAQAAGVACISVTFGYTPVEELKQCGAELFIDHFDELEKLIKAI